MHTQAQYQLKLNCTKHSGVLNVKQWLSAGQNLLAAISTKYVHIKSPVPTVNPKMVNKCAARDPNGCTIYITTVREKINR